MFLLTKMVGAEGALRIWVVDTVADDPLILRLRFCLKRGYERFPADLRETVAEVFARYVDGVESRQAG